MAIAFVSGAVSSSSTSASTTKTISFTSVAGDTLIVFAAGVGVNISGVADTAGNVYSLRAGPSTNTVEGSLWGTAPGAVKTSAAITITVTFASSTRSNAGCAEYSGVKAYGNVNNSATGSSTSPGAAVTTQDSNNFVVAGMSREGTSTWSTRSGVGTLRESIAGGGSTTPGIGIADNTAASAGSVTVGATISSSGAWCACAVELRSVALSPVSGSVSGLETLSGNLTGSGSLAGGISEAETLLGTLSASGLLAGSIAGSEVLSGTLQGLSFISGSISGSSILSATLTGSGALLGVILNSESLFATLSGSGVLVGSILEGETLSGILAGHASLQGSISGSEFLSAVLKASGLLVGAVNGAESLSGVLIGSGALIGTIAGSESLSGSLSSGGSTGVLSGAILGQQSLTGLLTGLGILSGVISGTELLLLQTSQSSSSSAPFFLPAALKGNSFGVLYGTTFSRSFKNPEKLDLIQVVAPGGRVIWSVNYLGDAVYSPASATHHALLGRFYGRSFVDVFPTSPEKIDLMQIVGPGGNKIYQLDHQGISYHF